MKEVVNKKEGKRRWWLIGGIIGSLVGLIGFTPFLSIIGHLILPLLAFTEGTLGIEVEGPCLTYWCKIPFGFFTIIYFGIIGTIIGLIIGKIKK